MIANKISKLLLLPLAMTLLLPTAVSAATGGGTTTTATITSADFTDLANVDAGLKAKIDALLAKGVFEGVSDNTFGIDQNMTRAQFAKILDLIYGVKVNSSVETSSFSDVKADDAANGWAIPYIEAAKKAGLVNGMTDTTFNPSDNLTNGQFATALVKGLGKSVDVSGSPWYSDAIKKAEDLNLLSPGSDGSAVTTRKDLVSIVFQDSPVIQQYLENMRSSSTPTPTPTPSPTPTPTPTPTSNSGGNSGNTTPTPPSVTSETYSTTSTSGAHVSIQSANASKLYYVLVTGDAQSPTATDVKSLQVHSGTLIDSGSASVTTATYEHDFTGLSTGVSYTLYTVAENAQGTLSSVKALSFGTAPPPSVTSVTYSTYISGFYVKLNLNLSFQLPDPSVASVVYYTYGCTPYTATADQILLGTGSPDSAILGHSSMNVSSGTTASITVDGLYAETEYYFYFVVVQNGVKSAAFKMNTIKISSSGS